LLGELGWNGLAGFGVILTYNAHTHLAFDLAGGVSTFGWKTGVRARYNLLASNMTPFVGIGFNATSGLGEFTSDPKDRSKQEPDAVPFTLNVKDSYLLQYTVGFDFVHRRGFNMVGALGYAQLLNDNNLELVDGKLTRDEQRAIDVIFKSGPVISLAAGYAFD
jgi:outer membrane protein W